MPAAKRNDAQGGMLREWVNLLRNTYGRVWADVAVVVESSMF